MAKWTISCLTNLMMMMTILLFSIFILLFIIISISTSVSITNTQHEKPNHRRLHHHSRLCWPFTFHARFILVFFPFCFASSFFAFSLSLLSVRFPYMFIARHTTVTLPPKYGVVDERAHINSLRHGRQERFSLLTAYTVERWLQTVRRTHNEITMKTKVSRFELSRVEFSGVSKREEEKKNESIWTVFVCMPLIYGNWRDRDNSTSIHTRWMAKTSQEKHHSLSEQHDRPTD